MKNRVLWLLCSAAIFMVVAPAAAEDVPATLSAVFENSKLRVAGMTRGGELAIDAVVVEPQGEVAVRVRRLEQISEDSDADGVIEYDFGTEISRRSIWGLVDVSSGGYVIATPAGSERNEEPFPSGSLKNTAPDDFDQIVHGYLILQMLWVRPGVGAWMGTTADGGAGDTDAQNNGVTVMSLSHLSSPRKGNSAVPKKLKKHDVLIFIDPFDMRFTSTTVQK